MQAHGIQASLKILTSTLQKLVTNLNDDGLAGEKRQNPIAKP